MAAIAAGLVASLLVETLSLGKTAPFDLAIVLLGIGAILVAATWTENYGEHKETEGGGEVDGKDSKDHTVAGEGNAKGSWLEKLGRAWEVVSQSPGVARLGISGALFEGDDAGHDA